MLKTENILSESETESEKSRHGVNKEDVRKECKRAAAFFKSHAAFPVLLLFVGMLFAFPGLVKRSAFDALLLCGRSLVPSLFPYITASKLCCGMLEGKERRKSERGLFEKVVGLPSFCLLPLLLGFLSGFPSGAVTAAGMALDGNLSKSEAEELAALSCTVSPAFCLAFVGNGIFGSTVYGLLVYVSVLCTSIVSFLICRHLFPCEKSVVPLHARECKEAKSALRTLCGAISGSAETMVKICGFTVFFYVASSLFSRIFAGVFGERITYLISAIFEISAGTLRFSACPFGERMRLTVMLCAFGGLSAIFQVISVLGEAGLSAKRFVFVRLMSAFVSPLFLSLFSRAYALAVYGKSDARVRAVRSFSAVSSPSFAVFAVIAFSLFSSFLFISYFAPKNHKKSKG